MQKAMMKPIEAGLVLPAISCLNLNGFRNFDKAKLTVGQARFVTLSGPNGAGKTNLLEAVSLLAPGRGLRRAKLEEMLNLKLTDQVAKGFAVHANLDCEVGEIDVGIGWQVGQSKQQCRLNGVDQKNQAVLGDYLSIVWLTPAMDRLFQDGAGARRRFFDRLVYAFDPAHAGRITAYDHAVRSRQKILLETKEKRQSLSHIPRWLDGLEQQIVQRGVAIAAARIAMIERLNQACKERRGPFPRASLSMIGAVEDDLQRLPSSAVETSYQQQLQARRDEDAESGKCSYGTHRSDINIQHRDKGMPAALCSTGEQKALLLSIVLADVAMQTAERGMPPLLLLDEVAAHLDPMRRDALYELLLAERGQIWMSGADANLFQTLRQKPFFNETCHFHVEQGQINQTINQIS